MDGNGRTVSPGDADSVRALLSANCLEVDQPWKSHGTVLQVGGWAYFNGDARDPNNPCGNDPLSMKLLRMNVGGTCPADGLVSYDLIPDTGLTTP